MSQQTFRISRILDGVHHFVELFVVNGCTSFLAFARASCDFRYLTIKTKQVRYWSLWRALKNQKKWSGCLRLFASHHGNLVRLYRRLRWKCASSILGTWSYLMSDLSQKGYINRTTQEVSQAESTRGSTSIMWWRACDIGKSYTVVQINIVSKSLFWSDKNILLHASAMTRMRDLLVFVPWSLGLQRCCPFLHFVLMKILKVVHSALTASKWHAITGHEIALW